MSGARPLTIAYDLRRMHRTGIGRYARNLFAALGQAAPQHRFVAVVQDDADAAEARTLVPSATCVIAPAAQYSPREMFASPRLPMVVDLLHSPHPYHWGIGGTRARVLTLLDVIQLTHAIGAKNLVAREPLRAIMRGATRRAAAMVAISETTRDAFHRQLGVPLDRITVTPLAPDPRFAAPVDAAAVAAARERWGMTPTTALYVGMTQPHKNLDRLLQALALLARAGVDARLAIVGPRVPAERARLDARLASLGIADRVHFLGWLGDDDLRLAYHAAAALALPSIAEGFGLTLLEAMSCGTPCLAADLPVLREVAGDAAVFADPLSPTALAEGLAVVLQDSARRAQLAEQGRRNAARYSWARTAQGTLAAYESAMTRISSSR